MTLRVAQKHCALPLRAAPTRRPNVTPIRPVSSGRSFLAQRLSTLYASHPVHPSHLAKLPCAAKSPSAHTARHSVSLPPPCGVSSVPFHSQVARRFVQSSCLPPLRSACGPSTLQPNDRTQPSCPVPLVAESPSEPQLPYAQLSYPTRTSPAQRASECSFQVGYPHALRAGQLSHPARCKATLLAVKPPHTQPAF